MWNWGSIGYCLLGAAIIGTIPYRCLNVLKPIKSAEDDAKALLEKLNREYSEDDYRQSEARWHYQLNMTEENLELQVTVESEVAKNRKRAWKQVNNYDWNKFSNYSLKRQFQIYSVLDSDVLPENKYKNLSRIISEMENIYSTSQICPNDETPWEYCTLYLHPDISDILATSRDPEELKHMWVKFREAVGPECRPLYEQYVELVNEAARLNNFSDYSEFWLKDYEDPDFKFKINQLWHQLKPLYQQLHAYVRTKLREKYGKIVSKKGPIPVHLLGNMWGQSWTNINNFTLPYPDIEDQIDIGKKLKKQHYTVIEMYETANEFYKSINLTKMPESFWKNSVLVKPKDVDMVCQPGAVDFGNGKDFRISHCAEVTEKDFITAHHEMGHIEYFLQYKDQPVRFRQGANDGFHEAIGDLITLSVQSPKHLRRINLYEYEMNDPKMILNNLFRLGMFQIAFLPFSYLTDLWRWDVFAGKTKPQDYNCRWWDLRQEYQGVDPPVLRSENDFDPAAKYHIVGDTPYLRYFISMVLQYQFHKALCTAIDEYEENNPKKQLHNCDIYKSKKAGRLLKKMLAMGSSRPWPDALEVLTGQREMDASGILEYFKPLHDWLLEENTKNDAFVGWVSNKEVCVRH